jgi:LuxR family maltose regulon positive regulatory protein
MLEIRTDDLRFTNDEATAFLSQVMGLDLSVEDMAALEARTEGWIVGLQMAALSLQGQEDTSEFIEAFSGSHHFVLDYLIDEVLEHQPKAVHSFLLYTSILEQMTGPLCDAVLASEGGQEMLEELHRTNLFVVPLDTERRWYRYHHLFAGLLRGRLRQTRPDLVGILNKRASIWYEENDLAVEAICHALAAQDYHRAAELVERIAMAVYQRGEMATLFKWIVSLPEPVVRRHPGVGVWQGWLLVSSGRVEDPEPLLKAVEERIQPGDLSPRAQSWRGGAAIVRATAAGKRGDMLAAIQQSRLALQLLPQDNPGDRAHRVTAGYFLGLGYVSQGELAKAEQTFAHTADLARAERIPFSAAMNLGEVARLCLIRGQLHRAANLYAECRHLSMSEEGLELPWMSIAKIGSARLAYEWNELDRAHDLLTEGIRHGKGWNSPDTLVAGHTVLSALLQAKGDMDGAGAALREAGDVLGTRRVRPDVRREWEVRQARWLLSQGDIMAARRWLPDSELPSETMPSFEQESAQILSARVLLAQNHADAALDLLALLARGAETGKRTGRLIKVLTLWALALQGRGDEIQAVVTLERALSLAEPEGYTRSFLDEGQEMAVLLRQVARRRTMPNYALKLLAATEQGVEHDADVGIGRRVKVVSFVPHRMSLVEPLSQRELEVLQLVAEGLSNRQIAAELIIALGTVKSHIHNILGKLDAQNRAQAVSRAKELGLI